MVFLFYVYDYSRREIRRMNFIDFEILSEILDDK